MGLYLNNYTDSTWSTTEEDCVRVIGGGDYCSNASKCRVSARGACWECVCILLMLFSVQYVFHDNQDSVY